MGSLPVFDVFLRGNIRVGFWRMFQHLALFPDEVDDPARSDGVDKCSDGRVPSELPLFEFFDNIDHDFIHDVFPVWCFNADGFFYTETDNRPVLGYNGIKVDVPTSFFHFVPLYSHTQWITRGMCKRGNSIFEGWRRLTFLLSNSWRIKMEAKDQNVIKMKDEMDFFTMIEKKLEQQGFEVLETLPPDPQNVLPLEVRD